MTSIHRLLFAVMGCCLTVVTIAAADRPLLLAINKGDRTLAIVDATTYKTLGKAPTGPDPHEVVASADGKLAYITNYNAGNGFTNSLSVVDLDAIKALPPIDLGSLSRPHGITLAGGKIYFTAEGSRTVARYDPAARKVDWSISTGQDGTHMVIVSKDLKRLFTTNIASASTSVIEDTAGQWQVATVPVGRGAEGFDLSPDEKELWVANARDASVSIIDTAARRVVQTLSVSFGSANRLKFTPDGKYALVSDLGGGRLIVLDRATRREVTRIDLGGGAAGIQMAPDGSRAFVAVGSRNGVAVVDLKTLAISTRIDTGPGPDGLAWVR